MVKKYVCIPHRTLVINVCNQGKIFMLTLYYKVKATCLPYYPTRKFGTMCVTTLKGKPLQFYSVVLNPNVLHNDNV